MTDKELLEAAAKAAGIENEGWVQDNWRCGLFLSTHIRFDALRPVWNPLSDDGDALRLAVKLGLEINQLGKNVAVGVLGTKYSKYWTESLGDDPYAATRRAIVRAATALKERER